MPTIAFDNTINTGYQSSANSVSASFTTSGTDRKLFAGVFTYSASLVTVTSMTYNGVAMTKVAAITDNLESNFQDVELWYIDAPSSGSNTLVASLSGTSDFALMEACSYTGAGVGIDASNTAQDNVGSSQSPACNVSIVGSTCWLVGFVVGRNSGPMSAGTNTVLRVDSSVGHGMGDSGAVIGPGSNTLSFGLSSCTWPGVVSASFAAAGSSAQISKVDAIAKAGIAKVDSVSAISKINGLTF